MLEYVLFHQKPYQLFIDWLKEKGLQPEVEIEEDDYMISLPDDLDESLEDEIEEKYDQLMDMNQKLANEQEAENNDGYHMAGVLVTLKDGTVSYADVNPELLGKVMSAISPEEFGEIVSAIADAVENPQTRIYCQRMREDRD